MIEGTHLSEGRGTTLPLEMFGAPKIDPQKVLKEMANINSKFSVGCHIRPCYFEPTFHKHNGEVCGGLQVHVDFPGYSPCQFKPYRLVATYFKAVRNLYPELEIWKQPPYEYEYEKLPIDILSGNDQLRNWVDDKVSQFHDYNEYLIKDESQWSEESREFYLY